MNSNCSNLLDMRNLQEQVKKAFCHQKMFWPSTVRINCSGDQSLAQFFLTVEQNNFGNKIPLIVLFAKITVFVMKIFWLKKNLKFTIVIEEKNHLNNGISHRKNYLKSTKLLKRKESVRSFKHDSGQVNSLLFNAETNK